MLIKKQRLCNGYRPCVPLCPGAVTVETRKEGVYRMKRKVVRDWISVILFPILIFCISGFLDLARAWVSSSYQHRTLWAASILSLILFGIMVARMVRVADELYKSPYFLIWTGLVLVVCIPFVIPGLMMPTVYNASWMKWAALLMGVFLFHLIKALSVWLKKWRSKNHNT